MRKRAFLRMCSILFCNLESNFNTWIRICIRVWNTDQDPATHLNTDPYVSKLVILI
jgi:hypothetical protein